MSDRLLTTQWTCREVLEDLLVPTVARSPWRAWPAWRAAGN